MAMDLQTYLRYLESRIAQLELKVQHLEADAQQLRQVVEQIRPIHIGQVHYKVQELSVRDLSGTLNIGLTALSDPKQLEQWLIQSEQHDQQAQKEQSDQLDQQEFSQPGFIKPHVELSHLSNVDVRPQKEGQ